MNSSLKQRCWVRCFQFSGSIIELFGKEKAKLLMDNHLHNIISHLPQTFEEAPLQEISTERFEGFISKLIKSKHNNHTAEALFLLIEKQYEDKYLFPESNNGGKSTNFMKTLLKNTNFEDITIPFTKIEQIQALTDQLKKHGHHEGENGIGMLRW